MGRVFTEAEGRIRFLLDNQISCLTEQLNEAVAKAIADGYVPDVAISNGPLLMFEPVHHELWGLEQPYVRVNFFRPGDSIVEK